MKVSRAAFFFASLSWPVTGIIITLLFARIVRVIWPSSWPEIFRGLVLVLAFGVGMIVASYVFVMILCSWVRAKQQKGTG